MPVARSFPTITRDFESAANPASRKYNRFGFENAKTPVFALVPKTADNAVAVLEQRDHRDLHVNLDPLVNPVVLKCPDHFQPSSIADMRKTGIFMSAKISLQDATVFCPVKNGAPGL